MRLNASKCFAMSIFHPRRNKITSSHKIHDHFLSSVEYYKYLGITIQSDLKWHNHIQLITSVQSQPNTCFIETQPENSIYPVKRKSISWISATKARICCYGMEPMPDKCKNTLEEVQRSAARYVKVIYSYDVSVTQMLNELQWESLRDQSHLIMFYNILKQNIYLPSKYIHEFHSQISQYQLQTRSCHMLRLAETFCNTDIYKYSFVQGRS